MIRYGLKNLYYRLFEVICICLFFAVILGTVLAAVSAGIQSQEGYDKLTKNYDIIIGAKGSQADLVFGSLTFSMTPENTIPISIYNELEASKKVPIAVGDSCSDGSLIVGTTQDFLEVYNLASGKSFTSEEDVFDIVIGYSVAKENDLHIGSKIVASHDSTHTHEENPYTVVGILAATSTNIDHTCFTYINNIWDMHHHEDEEDADESEEHVHETEQALTGILIKTSSLVENQSIVSLYDNRSDVTVVTINTVIRNLLSSTESMFVLVHLLVGMIIVIGTVGITVLLNQFRLQLKEDVIAIKSAKRNPFSYVLIQILIIIFVSGILSFFCRYIVLLQISKILAENGLVISPSLWR